MKVWMGSAVGGGGDVDHGDTGKQACVEEARWLGGYRRLLR
jgi:hypothetical protein